MNSRAVLNDKKQIKDLPEPAFSCEKGAFKFFKGDRTARVFRNTRDTTLRSQKTKLSVFWKLSFEKFPLNQRFFLFLLFFGFDGALPSHFVSAGSVV